MKSRPAQPRSPHQHRGFTLPEVLAALVLIGVVLPVALRGVSVALMAASKARHNSEAVELARHKLSELALASDAGSYAGSGDFGTDWPGYRWESRSVSRDYGVNEVTVEVFWKTRGQDESITLSTLAYPNGYLVGTTTSTDDTSTGTGSSTGGTQ
ncbi:MAG: type II secretion system protein [Tepidisphaeraceae bacterium]